jgi:hypothetical protein
VLTLSDISHKTVLPPIFYSVSEKISDRYFTIISLNSSFKNKIKNEQEISQHGEGSK